MPRSKVLNALYKIMPRYLHTSRAQLQSEIPRILVIWRHVTCWPSPKIPSSKSVTACSRELTNIMRRWAARRVRANNVANAHEGGNCNRKLSKSGADHSKRYDMSHPHSDNAQTRGLIRQVTRVTLLVGPWRNKIRSRDPPPPDACTTRHVQMSE